MERNANYALVGLISAILFAGMVVFVVWLAGNGFSRNLDIYNVIFHGPVRGLSEGGEVHFNGIKVGEVEPHLPRSQELDHGHRSRAHQPGCARPLRQHGRPRAPGHHRG